MVAADDDGQEAGPSGIGRPQSALSAASVVAAASDEEDESRGGISVQLHAYAAVSSYIQQYWCFIYVYGNNYAL